MIGSAWEVEQADLYGSVYLVVGTPFEVVHGDPPRAKGRWARAGRGWYGRRRPRGNERPALLTPPCSTVEEAVLSLERLGHLT